MRKNVNRYLAVLLVALMVVGVVPTQPVLAASAKAEENRTIEAMELDGETRLSETIAQDETKENKEEMAPYAEDELVTVIVEMEEAPVLDYYGVSTYSTDGGDAGEAVSDFLTSDEAEELADELIEQQNTVLEKLEEVVEVEEVVDQWTSVVNAVAVKVPYGKLDQIKNMDGVKRAYVEHVFDRPDEPITTEAGEIAGYSYDMVGIQEAWGKGYTGKGMLVAIMDTGLDMNWQAYVTGAEDSDNHIVTSHEAFREDSFKNEDAKEALRYTNESMEQFLKDNTLNAEFRGGNTELTYDYNALYKNSKIPFAYDYADLDLNVQPGSSSHGTHVAGTIGGYVENAEGEVTFSGVAPDAQLMIMKVFPDADGGAQESDMVAALEDAVKLGADVINLSLGSDNGFAEDDTIQENLYDRVREAGILLMTSAGNSASSSASNNYGGNNLTDDPETSMMSSPAVYDSNLAVASINNSVDVVSVFEWTDQDGEVHQVAYNDPNETSMKYKFLGEEVNIIPVGGYGTSADYEAAGFRSYYGYGEKGVTGIALVQRGEISFTDKIKNASNFVWNYYDSQKGSYVSETPVKAVLVYDNVDGDLITMSTDGTYLTSAFISKADGEAIIEAINAGCEVKIRVQKDDELIQWDQKGQMSEFTSWGAGPSLELKPEITAPGGNIWSTIVDDGNRLRDPENYTGSYGMMSGTSMAAPHMTGITALVEQYVQTEHNGTKQANADLTSQLMVSTAIPQKQEDGVYYSPRVQGAGLANAAAAMNTPAYITVEGQSIGKLELKDDPEKTGTYDLEFTVHNLTDQAVTYEANAVLQYPKTETVESEWGTREVMLDADQKLGEFVLGTVSVPANGSVTVSKTVTLDANQKKALDVFKNGTYVEGFILLNSANDEVPQIGLPVLAFYGDWTSAPIFDNGTWLDAAEDGTTVLNNECTWGVSDIAYFDGYGYYTLGMNPFDEDAAEVYSNFFDGNITLAPGTGLYQSINDFVLYQLRQARAVIVEVHDSKTNELYYHDIATYLWKSTYNSSYATAIPTSVSYFTGSYWTGTDLDGNVLPNGTQCTMTITAYGDGEYPTTYNETLGREATDFDSLVPGSVEPTFNGRKMDMTGDVISFSVLVDTEAPKIVNNAVSCKAVDGKTILSGSFDDKDGSLASIAVYPQVKRTYKEGYGNPEYVEYGMDQMNPFLNMTINEEDVHTKEFSCDVTSYAHTIESYVGENNYYNYEWTGNVYVFGGDYGGNDRGYAVTVNTESGLVLSQTSALLSVGDQFNLSVIDNTDAGKEITRTSSNPEVATVDEQGLVTALATGQTTIEVSNGISSAVCIVAVQDDSMEVEDFNLTITEFNGLKPNGSMVVSVKDIQPSGAKVDKVEWKVYENDPDLYEGLVTVQQNATDGLTGEIYLNASASNDDEVTIPGSDGYLEVTINGSVTRRLDFDWTDLYHKTTDEDLISDLYGGQQTVYVEQGETATLIAKYNNSNAHQAIDVKLYSPVGAANYSSNNPTEPSVGLVLDGPDFASVGGTWKGKLVNQEGYQLPESVQIGYTYPNSDGSHYEYWWDNSYGYYFTYDSTTGEIVVNHAPYGSNNQLVIRADGVESAGTLAGSLSGTTYTKPEPLYGPFDWKVTEGKSAKGELTTQENVTLNGYSKNVAYFTPSEPGVSYITATTKDGKYSVNYAVICEPTIADTLKLDTKKVTMEIGETYGLKATLDPEPTLDLNKQLTWTSFNPEVATVDENGVITAVSAGDAYIKVCTTTAPGRNTETQSYCIIHVNERAKYTVTFCDYDGTVLEEQLVEEGNSAVPPQDPKREGYNFTGWDKKFDQVTDNMTITATYERIGTLATQTDKEKAEGYLEECKEFYSKENFASAEVWNAYQEALTKLENLLAKDDVTKEEIQAAVDAVDNAVKAGLATDKPEEPEVPVIPSEEPSGVATGDSVDVSIFVTMLMMAILLMVMQKRRMMR